MAATLVQVPLQVFHLQLRMYSSYPAVICHGGCQSSPHPASLLTRSILVIHSPSGATGSTSFSIVSRIVISLSCGSGDIKCQAPRDALLGVTCKSAMTQ